MLPMSTLLTKIPPPITITPAQFAALFRDFDFDGTATDNEMMVFWGRALACLQFSNKSRERVTALLRLGALLHLEKSGTFPRLSIRIVVFQLILRLMKPERVAQKNFGLCGPAAFAVLLIKSKPLVYIGMAISLLLNGQANGDDGSDIVPGDYVKNYNPEINIPQADWLIAASLRNADTPIPLGKNVEGMLKYGGTYMPDVFAYFLRAGYSNVIGLGCYLSSVVSLLHLVDRDFYEQYYPVESKNLLPDEFGRPSDPIVNIRIAAKLRKDGWRVLLSVNAAWAGSKPIDEEKVKNLEKSASQFDRNKAAEERRKMEELQRALQPASILGFDVPNSNHWVLAKKITLDGQNHIEATLYTWGEQYHPVKAPVESFVKAYGGFIAARG